MKCLERKVRMESLAKMALVQCQVKKVPMESLAKMDLVECQVKKAPMESLGKMASNGTFSKNGSNGMPSKKKAPIELLAKMVPMKRVVK